MLKRAWGLIQKTTARWKEDEASRKAAALAYYTIFAMAPLLLVAIFVSGLLFERTNAVGFLSAQAETFTGSDGANIIRTIVRNAPDTRSGVLPSVIGIGLLLFSASGLFIQIKAILNRVWGVDLQKSGGFWTAVRDRLLSILAVVGIGVLLLTTLLLNALLGALRGEFLSALPGWFPAARILGLLFSTLLTTSIFAVMYKFLPDVQVAWRDVWIGAGLTAVLFLGGQYLLGFYFGRAQIGSAYGAAGSLIALLLWIYYSAQIWLFGAEMTKVYADSFGSRVLPENVELSP